MIDINQIKQKVVPIAIKHGVDSLALFGSYARNEQTNNSDLDFIIDKGAITGFFSYYALVEELEKNFNCHVDVVTTDIKDNDFLDNIKKDIKVLYVRN